ncbi:MAG TPA: ABC transporter ATP-binding protein [Pyrinomonadaceae bacterium]|nr:ABC transporter ATP-binding protein [Pyrinomonadaceae bacterium]
MAIAVNNLTKKYGDFAAISDVSFQIEDGETFALLGPNGSGKTTTLKCLAGLTTPTAGTIRVGVSDLAPTSRRARQLMSYLPQRVTFHEQLTAREVLTFYCRLRRLPMERIEHTLNGPGFQFNGFSDKFIGEFSAGMIQRLGLAVACLPDAPVLVLDEPTVSLDPEGAIHFRQFLASKKRQRKTIVFSSHMLAEVEQLADRVGIMMGGRLVAIQSIATLRDDLTRNSRLRIRLLNPDPHFLDVATVAGAVAVSPEGNTLRITAAAEARLPILRAIEAAGGQIERFETEELSLEDIYMEYVGKSVEPN